MAKFTLDRFDSTQAPIEVDHAIKIVQSGIEWVGQYNSKFGETLLTSMLHISENFAGPNPPDSFDTMGVAFGSIDGQLWYDTDETSDLNNKILKVYNGNTNLNTNGWKRIELILNDTLPTIYTEGEMFFKTDRQTLSVSRENRWENVSVELAYDSEKLIGIDGEYYMRKDIDQTMVGILSTGHIRPSSNFIFDLGTNNLRYREAYFQILNTNSSRTLVPTTTLVDNLGSLSNRWGNLYVDVVRSNSFINIMPLSNATYDIGSNTRKWNNFHTVNVYGDKFSNIFPINNTSVIGGNTNRWDYAYLNHLNTNLVTSNLNPTPTTTHTLGSNTNKWLELNVDIIRSSKFDTLIPNTPSSSVGTVDKPFDTLFVANIAGGTFVDDLNFDIIRNSKSKGLTWTGLDDKHSIYVEEVSNASNTKLIIESGTNIQDTTVIRNNGNDILEVSRTKVVAKEDIQANKRFIVSDGTSKGISIEYNTSIGAMEFKFI